MLLQGGEKIAIPGFTRNPLLDPLHRISLSGLALVLYLLHTAGENGRSAVRVYHAQRVIRADEAAGATTAMTATMVSAGEISRLERAAAKPAAGAWGSRPWTMRGSFRRPGRSCDCSEPYKNSCLPVFISAAWWGFCLY